MNMVDGGKAFVFRCLVGALAVLPAACFMAEPVTSAPSGRDDSRSMQTVTSAESASGPAQLEPRGALPGEASASGQEPSAATEPPAAPATAEQVPEGLRFPEGFVFGTAIAGFQADMGCPSLTPSECSDRASDWYQFTTDRATTTSPGAHLSGQDPERVGPGFWELFSEDIARADEQLHNGGLRFSLEWSRIFPTATDGVQGHEALRALADPRALARYHAMLTELNARGMQPVVTLNHYSLPVWIHDAVGCHEDFDNCSPRGWVDSERTIREITKYAAFCAREFGAQVDVWATLNEPLQNMLFGYLMPGEERSHPPAVSLKTTAARVVFNALIEAHARMYEVVKRHDTVDVDGDGHASFIGLVYPLVPIVANDPGWFLDNQAVQDVDYLWNRAFLRAVALGEYDEELNGESVYREDLAGRMDYIGVNWYFSMRVSGLGFSFLPQLTSKLTANPLNFEKIPNGPGALIKNLAWINQELGLPAIITENGVPDPGDDGTGPRYLVENLRELALAIEGGADVRGYFYWTLMDNFEWNHGMDERMGLYAVDAQDPLKRRVPRQTVETFAEIARWGVLPEHLLAEHGF